MIYVRFFPASLCDLVGTSKCCMVFLSPIWPRCGINFITSNNNFDHLLNFCPCSQFHEAPKLQLSWPISVPGRVPKQTVIYKHLHSLCPHHWHINICKVHKPLQGAKQDAQFIKLDQSACVGGVIRIRLHQALNYQAS